jgi:hypothetical protein
MSGLDGACGASTPDPDPGGIRLGGPIDPGGRGIESKPGGVCAKAGDARSPHMSNKAAKDWRPRGLAAAPAIMMPGLPPEIGRIQAAEPLVCQRSGAMLGANRSLPTYLHEIACPTPWIC